MTKLWQPQLVLTVSLKEGIEAIECCQAKVPVVLAEKAGQQGNAVILRERGRGGGREGEGERDGGREGRERGREGWREGVEGGRERKRENRKEL